MSNRTPHATPALVRLQRSWQLYKQSFSRLFPIAFLLFALVALYRFTMVPQLAAHATSRSSMVATALISQLILLCFFSLLLSLALLVLHQHYSGKLTPFKVIFKASMSRFFSMLVATIALFIFIFIVPGLLMSYLSLVISPIIALLLGLVLTLVIASFTLIMPCIQLFEYKSVFTSLRLSINRSKSVWLTNLLMLVPSLFVYLLISNLLLRIVTMTASSAGFGIEEVLQIFLDALLAPYIISLMFTQYIHELPADKNQS